jgi:hypothetical protein
LIAASEAARPRRGSFRGGLCSNPDSPGLRLMKLQLSPAPGSRRTIQRVKLGQSQPTIAIPPHSVRESASASPDFHRLPILDLASIRTVPAFGNTSGGLRASAEALASLAY